MNESNENGLGWVAAAITGAVSITTALIQNLNAKKAAKKAAKEAAEQNKVNAFAALDNQYYATSNAASNATNTRVLIFGAVGLIGAYLLLKD